MSTLIKSTVLDNIDSNSYSSWYKIKVDTYLNSQSIADNKSNITLKAYIATKNNSAGWYTYGTTRLKTALNVNNEGWVEKTNENVRDLPQNAANVWKQFGEWTGNVAHLSSGKQKINVRISFTDSSSDSYMPKDASTDSGDFDLPTIPRASTIGVLDANIGASTIISIAKADASFKTTLKYKASGQSTYTTIVEKTTQETYPWTVPDSLYSLIPNSKTITCEFIAETYSGDDLIGTSESFTATFTAVNAPVIYSVGATDTNNSTLELTGLRTTMVRYKSNVLVRVTTTAQNEASIKSVTVNGVACTLFDENIYQTTFNSASVNTFEVVVTDSRGNIAKQTKTMSVVEYIPLTLNASAGRTSATGDKVKLKFSGNYFIGNFGAGSNTLSVKYRVLQSSTVKVDWTALSVTPANNKYSAEVELSGFNYNEAYTIEIQASDKLTTTTKISIAILKSIPTWAFGDDWFDIYCEDFKIQNKRLIDCIYPVGSIYMTIDDTSPEILFGGVWEQIKDRFILGASDETKPNKTGGSGTHTHTTASHTLTIDEIPSHEHKIGRDDDGAAGSAGYGTIHSKGVDGADRLIATSAVGGGNAHNHGSTGSASNYPPYYTAWIWKRTA